MKAPIGRTGRQLALRLEALEARSRALFESNPHPMWIYDLDTLEFLDVNEAAIQHYGYSREEFRALTLADIRPPEDVAALRRTIASVTSDFTASGIWRHRKKDGTPIEVEITRHAIDYGERRAEVVLAHDVTRRRRQEQALHTIAAGVAAATGEQFFRDAVCYLASVLRMRYVLVGELVPGRADVVRTLAVWSGDRVVPNFEYPLAGTPCDNVVSQRPCAYSRDVQRLFPADRMLAELEVESYLGTPLLGSTGAPLGLIAALHDQPLSDDIDLLAPVLTIFGGRAAAELERRHAEQALRRSEEMKRALLSAMPDLMFLLDREGRYLEFNAPEPSLLFARPEEILGRRVDELLPPEAGATCMSHVRETFASGKPCSFGYELRVGGDVRRFEARLVPRGPDELLAVVRDVTEQRRLEERMEHTQRLESLGVLAGGIAHDFNNLLAIVLGAAELAGSQLPLEASGVRAYIDSIVLAAERGAELTRQLLAYAGKRRFDVALLDLNAVVREMVQLLRAVIGPGVAVTLELDPELPPLAGDVTQMRQVVMNLVTNAAEALGDGAGTDSITIRTRHEPTGQISLEVADTGAGMDTATRNRIFDPFFTTKFTGRGLGLAVVLGIVRAHGGTIRVDSAPGRGARFVVLIPQAGAGEQAAIPVSPHGGSVAADRRTVLLIEDEEQVRGLLRQILEQRCWRVLAAEDGNRGVELFAAHGPEILLVVIDMVMPRMGGLETLRQIRGQRADVAVLCLSGYSDAQTMDALARERAAFLHKPFTARALHAAVDAALEV